MGRRAKKVGKRSLGSPPTWHAQSRTWRKRVTIEGKQREFRYKYPNDAVGGRRANVEWQKDLLILHAGEEQLDQLELSYHLKATKLMNPQLVNRRTIHDATIADADRGYTEDECLDRAEIRLEAIRVIRQGDDQEAVQLLRKVCDQQVQTNQRIANLLDEYMAHVQQRRNDDEIGVRRFGEIRLWVKTNKTTAFGLAPIPKDEKELQQRLREYRDTWDSADISPWTFNSRMKEVKAFIDWAHNNYHLSDLPRNVKQLLKMKPTQPTAKSVTDQQLGLLWQQADDMTRTFMALALNCGFYANDIGRLPRTCLVENGTCLDFVRLKTQRKVGNGRGVKIRYELWPVTQKLISATMTNKGNFLFVRPNGKPYYMEHKDSRSDYIGKAFHTCCAAAKVTGISFSNLRDTAATRIEAINPKLTDTFLAHTDDRVARFYLDGNRIDYRRLYADLALATNEVGSQLASVLER